MNFFLKIYTSFLAVVSIALIAMGFFFVSSSMNKILNSRIDSSIENHVRVCSKIKRNTEKTVSGVFPDYDVVSKMAAGVSEEENTVFYVYKTLGDRFYPDSESQFAEIPDDYDIHYYIAENDGVFTLIVYCRVYISNTPIIVESNYDVTDIFEESRNQQMSIIAIMLVTFIFTAVIAALLSRLLIKPIESLNNAETEFQKGNYDSRAVVSTRDEIGNLARNYNQMAESIQEKIDSLELSVKQREDFTAAFAHELKTPMTSIIGYSEALQNKDIEDPEVRAALEYIHNESLRLEGLSFKLMKLINVGKSELVLEEELTTEFFDDIKLSVNELSKKYNSEIIFEIEEGYIKIELDLFKTLVLNLIDNAFKSGADRIVVSGKRTEDNYVISVSDNGRGIPSEDLSRVTEAFYMVDKARSRKENGTGLGLSLVASIAEAHDGELSINSEEGKGTTISVTLGLLEDIYEE